MSATEDTISRKIISDVYKYYTSQEKDSKLGFDINDAFQLIPIISQKLNEEPAVLEIMTDQNSDFVIASNIHGNINSLFKIFESKGYPDTTKYLFLGDYVDGGENSCEVIITLYAYKCLYPNQIYLLRGNHEFIDMTNRFGFKNECLKRIPNPENEQFYRQITYTFKYLPICSILSDKIFCIHGGISALIENRTQILSLKKVGDQFCADDSVQAEFLWSIPDNSISLYEPSDRGIACLFGIEALYPFLENMDFELIIGAQKTNSDDYWPFGENGQFLSISLNDNHESIAYYPKSDDIRTRIIPEIQIL